MKSELKTCRVCNVAKPLTEYNLQTDRGRTRHITVCKPCNCEIRKGHRERSRRVVVCNGCGAERSVTERSANGRLSKFCRTCAAAKHQKRGKDHPEYCGTEHIAGKIYGGWRKNAKYPWGLTIDDVEAIYVRQKGLCALSGRPLTATVNDDDKMSLDRIDSTKGYEPTNCQLTTTAANVAKRRLTVDGFVKLAVDVVRTHSLPLSVWMEGVANGA